MTGRLARCGAPFLFCPWRARVAVDGVELYSGVAAPIWWRRGETGYSGTRCWRHGMRICVIGAGAIGGLARGQACARRRRGLRRRARRRISRQSEPTGCASSKRRRDRRAGQVPQPTASPISANRICVILGMKAHQIAAVCRESPALLGPRNDDPHRAERHPLVVLLQTRRPARRPAAGERRSRRRRSPTICRSTASSAASSIRPPRSQRRASSGISRAIASRSPRSTMRRRRASRRCREALHARRLQGAGRLRHPRRNLDEALGQCELQSDQRADPCHA